MQNPSRNLKYYAHTSPARQVVFPPETIPPQLFAIGNLLYRILGEGRGARLSGQQIAAGGSLERERANRSRPAGRRPGISESNAQDSLKVLAGFGLIVVCFAKVTLHEMNAELNPLIDCPSTSLNSATIDVVFAPAINAVPAFNVPNTTSPADLRRQIEEACRAWLSRSPSSETRAAYSRELFQFLRFSAIVPGEWERLLTIRPNHVAAWRDQLLLVGQSNAAVNRKLTVLRSFFSFLRTYGYLGANPAHPVFVASPAVPRDGKTVALTPEDCRRILDAADAIAPEGIRDRALLAVLAYTGCRVGELCRLRVADLKSTGGHRVLEIRGKGGKERRVPLHAEAVERLETWIERAGLQEAGLAPMFRPAATARGRGHDGFFDRSLSRRSVQYLVTRYVKRLGLDPNITVHSFRATALTTARERGADIVDLQDFAGHSDPRTTLAYIRNRDRLSRSPAYVLRY